MHPIRALLKRYGLSEINIIELSDLLSEDAIILEKKLIPEEKPSLLNYGTPTRYEITFQTKNLGIMTFYNEEWFRNFETREKVILKYKTRHCVTMDYIAPNFTERQQIRRMFSGYELEQVLKVQEASPSL